MDSDLPRCSYAETAVNSDLVFSTEYKVCEKVVNNFLTCYDDCVATFAHSEDEAVECVDRYNRIATEIAAENADKCEDARQNTTNKYMPVPRPKAATCKNQETNTWNYNYGTNAERDTGCDQVGTCSDFCLDFFTKSVQEAPACRNGGTGEFTVQEMQKAKVVNCLRSRGENVDAAVLFMDDSTESTVHHVGCMTGATVVFSLLLSVMV